MPATVPDPNGWLAQQIAQLKRDVAALKTQSTQYVVDASGTAQAMIGNLAFDPSGAKTGLAGSGIAAWNGSAWVPVPLGFLELLSAGRVQVAFGTGTLTWTGGQNSASVSIAHGLGRTPQSVTLTLVDGTELATIQEWGAPDATNLHALGWVATGTLPNGTTRNFHWTAIG